MSTPGFQESRNTISDSEGLIEARYSGVWNDESQTTLVHVRLRAGRLVVSDVGICAAFSKWRRGCAGVCGEEGNWVPVTSLVVMSY
jgi:hypothetical protein